MQNSKMNSPTSNKVELKVCSPNSALLSSGHAPGHSTLATLTMTSANLPRTKTGAEDQSFCMLWSNQVFLVFWSHTMVESFGNHPIWFGGKHLKMNETTNQSQGKPFRRKFMASSWLNPAKQ